MNKISDYIKDGVDVLIKISKYDQSETLMKVLDYLDDRWADEPIETAIHTCLDKTIVNPSKELIVNADSLDNTSISIIEANSKIVNVEDRKSEIYLSIEDRD